MRNRQWKYYVCSMTGGRRVGFCWSRGHVQTLPALRPSHKSQLPQMPRRARGGCWEFLARPDPGPTAQNPPTIFISPCPTALTAPEDVSLPPIALFLGRRPPPATAPSLPFCCAFLAKQSSRQSVFASAPAPQHRQTNRSERTVAQSHPHIFAAPPPHSRSHPPRRRSRRLPHDAGPDGRSDRQPQAADRSTAPLP